MKPTPYSTGRNRATGANEIVSNGFPVTDSAYQSVTLNGYRGGCANTCAPSFRSISNDYFKTEARQSFVTEAAFFAVFVVISSWPILLSVQAMTHLVRAYAGL
jgi:hypothetical protein